MSGQTIINDPATSNPVITTSGPKQNTVFSDPITQTPRVVEGLLPDNTYGMWVSKPGMDVTTATATDLIFNSNQDVFKIVGNIVGNFQNVTVAPSSGQFATNSGTTAIPHNLGYAPAILGYINNANTFYSLPYQNNFGGGTTAAFATYSVDVDNINVYLTLLLTAFGGSETASGSLLSAKVYLLQESAN